MAPLTVFVIGCGIAGPVLAVFLKRKGYHPIIFERADGVHEAGVSLMLQPNGLKVLNLLPGLLDRLPGKVIQHSSFFSAVPSPGQSQNQGQGLILASADFPSKLPELFGHGMRGVSRTHFHQVLVDYAKDQGVEIRWGHALSGLEQHLHEDGVEEKVDVTFGNGVKLSADFVVGCDGLHSNTRIELFGAEKPSFTGLVQTSGISPVPNEYEGKPTMINLFGLNEHMISYAIADDMYSWAVSSPESESKETWRSIDDEQKEAFKKSYRAQWPFGAGSLVKNAYKVIKYGLYDRPELKTWYKGRVCLLGDAAHPTTPHLGQGANQALEDVYHFVRSLTKHHPSSESESPLPTPLLQTIFAEYESVRFPRSTALVKGAQENGRTRVVADLEEARRRDEKIRAIYANPTEETFKAAADLFGGPFSGESGI